MDDQLPHQLLLAFDTDEPAFARGFEVGRLWARLVEQPAETLEETVHASNAEMLLRLAEATGRTVRTIDVDEAWVTATFSAASDLESAP